LFTLLPLVSLEGLGHDVITAAQIDQAAATDMHLLNIAHQQGRIFVTQDRDFDELVFVQDLGAGVIYLRVLPSTQVATYAELNRGLGLYAEDVLITPFVVVEPGRHCLRRHPRQASD
jgi:predicted nuclease of predicted toxin-antitoxin system